MEALTQFITLRVNLTADELSAVLSCFKEVSFKKDAYILRTGHFSTSYYFIKSGGVRTWFQNGETPITAWLFFEHDFFSELSGLRSGQPSRFNIQAIADTVVLAIDKAAMERLYTQLPEWQRFGRIIAEDAFLKVIDGIMRHQTLSAEERYRAVMQRSDLMQQIPLKQLASFLGITPTSLSRIRKQIS